MIQRYRWHLALLAACSIQLHAREELRFEAQAPLLSSGTMTQMNMASLFANGAQPTGNLVTVSVVNTGTDSQTFRLLFELKAIPANQRIRESCTDLLPEEGGQGCWVQRKILSNVTLAPGQAWVKTSSALENETFQSKGIEADNSPFQRMVAREGQIPPGALYLNVALLCPAGEYDKHENMLSQSTEGLCMYQSTNRNEYSFFTTFQPTQPVLNLAPGSSASQGFDQIQTTTPTFVFAGNLDGFDLGGESPYRISIWEVRAGESVGEAMDRRPVRTATVDRSPVPWRGEWTPLENNKRYLWRVDAILRGLTNDWLPSQPFGFVTPTPSPEDKSRSRASLGGSIAPTTDAPHPTPEQLEIMEQLALIIGPYRPVLEQLVRTSLPDPFALRIGANPASRTDFRNLVRDILDGRASVVGAEAKP